MILRISNPLTVQSNLILYNISFIFITYILNIHRKYYSVVIVLLQIYYPSTSDHNVDSYV